MEENKQIQIHSQYLVEFLNDIAMLGQREDLLIEKGNRINYDEYRKIIEDQLPNAMQYDRCRFCEKWIKVLNDVAP